MSTRKAILWSIIWITASLLLNLVVYFVLGYQKALEFFTGYVIEKSLSVDNLFVFLLIFSYFNVQPEQQRRVLNYGIIGAVILRGILILLGTALVHQFHWILYALGAFLLYAAIKVLIHKQADIDPSRNLVLRLFRRLARVAEDETGAHFLVRRDGKLWATPLLAVLVVIEAVDVTFAVDSIPAIFGVTTDFFIVLTSNVFAILGLRSLFFLVSGLARRLPYLNYGIAAVLAFIGAKIMLQDLVHIPVLLSLATIVGALLVATVASLLARQRLSK